MPTQAASSVTPRTCFGVYCPAAHATQEPVLVLPLPLVLYSKLGSQAWVPVGGLQLSLSALASAATASRQATASRLALVEVVMVDLQSSQQVQRVRKTRVWLHLYSLSEKLLHTAQHAG